MYWSRMVEPLLVDPNCIDLRFNQQYGRAVLVGIENAKTRGVMGWKEAWACIA